MRRLKRSRPSVWWSRKPPVGPLLCRRPNLSIDSSNPKTGRLYRVVSSPPPALRKARLDNFALLPASLLPFKAEYQAIANQQAPGTTWWSFQLATLSLAELLKRFATECRLKVS